MIDISATGSKITIEFGNGGIVEISEFSDEGTPFESPSVDVSTNNKNLNGQMISSRTPSVYPVSLTVIPGSDADIELSTRFQAASIQPGNVTKISDLIVKKMTVLMPNINESASTVSSGRSYTYTNGRIKTGPTGPSTSSAGRQSPRTFSFEFEKYSTSGIGTGMNVNSI